MKGPLVPPGGGFACGKREKKTGGRGGEREHQPDPGAINLKKGGRTASSRSLRTGPLRRCRREEGGKQVEFGEHSLQMGTSENKLI